MIPPGFSHRIGYFGSVDFTELHAAIAWQQRTFRMFGRDILQPRLTAWYGDAAYTYSGQRHEPAPMPTLVRTLCERVCDATGMRCNSVLANLYRNGSDSVSLHSDDEPELGTEPTIASLSFGAARDFRVHDARTRKHVHTFVLGHGDLLVMSGRSQADYLHAIPKTKAPLGYPGARINLTFRYVTE